MLEYVEHGFEPVYDKHSKILILGSFPSVKSRQQQFYYGHPQNRFWKVLAALADTEVPQTVEEKKEWLYAHHIAVYDVIEACEIEGSSDSSIKNVKPADIGKIVEESEIERIYTNGKTAGKLYRKYQAKTCTLPMAELPSTSPANAMFSLERLIDEWRKKIKMTS